MSAGAVIALRRKKLVKRFREAGATDSQHAVMLEDLGERRSWIFDQMLAEGVFAPAEGNRFFMNEQTADAFLRQRRNRAWFLGMLLLLAFLLFWIFAWITG